MLSPRSCATTLGISVDVESKYAKEQSRPLLHLYFFIYTITIRNDSKERVQLKSRHWIITDANQHIEEVRGAGVVGETPIIDPGKSFTYSSGCMLRTSYGVMCGSYQMMSQPGEVFEVEIAPFLLAVPHAVN